MDGRAGRYGPGAGCGLLQPRRGYHRLPVRPQTGPAVMPNPDVPLALRDTSPARS